MALPCTRFEIDRPLLLPISLNSFILFAHPILGSLRFQSLSSVFSISQNDNNFTCMHINLLIRQLSLNLCAKCCYSREKVIFTQYFFAPPSFNLHIRLHTHAYTSTSADRDSLRIQNTKWYKSSLMKTFWIVILSIRVRTNLNFKSKS